MTVDVTVEDRVALAVLRRPEKRNALTPEMVVRLAEFWDRVQDDDSIRVAVLTGSNGTFTSGADLGRLIPLLTRARRPEDEWDEALLSDRRLLDRALLRRTDFAKPVIAAVNGPALAGGTELVLASDLRIATGTAVLGLLEAHRGIIPAGGALARLNRQIGHAAAMELTISGEPMDAYRAHQLGLFNQIVHKTQLMTRATAVAARVAAAAPLALRAIKSTLTAAAGVPLDEAFRIESAAARDVMRSNDAREGPRAFLERREPRFTGT